MSFPKELETHLRFFEQVSETLKLSEWLTPLNLKEERLKFLDHPRHNPHFIYQDLPVIELQKILRSLELHRVPDGQTLEHWVLSRRLEELKLETQLLISRGSQVFSAISCQLYDCRFDAESIQHAQHDAALEVRFEVQERRTPSQIVIGIEDYLKHYGVTDWSVELVTQTDFYFRVRPTKKQIFISERFNWDFCDFDNMLAHEIDGHVLRAVNAHKQTHPFLQKPLPFYIKTEEGLGAFLADYCSTTAELSRKHHALKYLAGYVGLTGSFLDIFEFLVSHGFTPDLAFQRTFRLKRGFENTALPGCYGKEAMYYEGMLEVKSFLDKDRNAEVLYSGKVGLQDLKFVTVPKQVIIPKRLDTYIQSL